MGAILSVVAIGATIVLGFLTTAFEVLTAGPAIQSLWSGLSQVYFWGAATTLMLEIGIDFSQIKRTGSWLRTPVNVLLWPVMWPVRWGVASMLKGEKEIISKGLGDGSLRPRDIKPCDWQTYLRNPLKCHAISTVTDIYENKHVVDKLATIQEVKQVIETQEACELIRSLQ